MSKSFSLVGVAITAGGIPIRGFQDGDAYSVSRNSDENEAVVGADGDVEINTLNDKSGVVTLTVMYGSKANQVFGQLHAAGDPFPISIRDTTGAYDMYSAGCRVLKLPDVSAGRAAAPVEWTFIAPSIKDSLNGIDPD